jgi:dTDP-4-amino-4,6-dideoxygalactose transaminase
MKRDALPTTVPFLDLRGVMGAHKAQMMAAFERVLDSGWYILGREVQCFEAAWASYCGALHAVGVANGLDALILALTAVGVGPGDEVIVPANTYIATWLAVSHLGAVPVPVEPDPASWNIDVTRIERAITPRTKALLPVHLYGQSANLAPIVAIARHHGLAVVEDAAQAHGACYRGERIGAHGDAVAWSFYPGKNLGALGDGGAVTTNRDDVAERIRVLRNYGSRVNCHNEVIGRNSRLDELQAALLTARLAALDGENAARAAIAERYLDELDGAGHGLVLPLVPAYASPVWHLFVVRHPKRNALAQALAERGVGTVIHYPVAPHLQPAYRHLGLAAGALPFSERLHDEVLSLPIGPTQTPWQTELVIEAVRGALRTL